MALSFKPKNIEILAFSKFDLGYDFSPNLIYDPNVLNASGDKRVFDFSKPKDK